MRSSLIAILVLVCPLSSAFADNATVSTQDGTPSILDKVYLNYFAIFHGPELGDMTSSRTLNNKGQPSTFPGTYFDSEITLAYKLTNTIGVGPDIPFLLVVTRGQGIVMGDAGVKMYNRETFTGIDNLHIYTNLILQAPTSADSQNRRMRVGIKTTPAIRYDVPRSRFTFGAWTEGKVYAGVTQGKELKLYAEPYVAYQLNRNFALNLGYEMEAHHDAGTNPALQFTNYQTDLEPGVVWFISKKVLVNPYVQIFTGNTITMDTTAVGAVISATVL